MATESDVEPRTLASLPAELLMLVAAELDARCLARFAAVCTICPAAAQGELRRELRAAVLRSLVPGGPRPGPEQSAMFWSRPRTGAGLVSDVLVACPYFRLPDDLLILPVGAFRSASLTKITLPASLTTIEHGVFRDCSHLTEVTLPATLTTL